MKLGKIFGALSLFGVLFSYSAEVFAQQPPVNPFRQGLRKEPLTKEEKDTLLAYLNTSMNNLKKLVQKTSGKTFEEANSIYFEGLKEIVIDSFKDKPRTELLMRYAINQALELTYGVPSANGQYIESPAILANINNPELVTMILEDSIDLAIEFYQDDLTAVEANDLLNLPYIKFAGRRLTLARNWIGACFNDSLVYDLSVASILHWNATVRGDDNLKYPRLGEALVLADGHLAAEQVGNPGRMNWGAEELSSKIRVLRGIVNWLISETSVVSAEFDKKYSDLVASRKASLEKQARLDRATREKATGEEKARLEEEDRKRKAQEIGGKLEAFLATASKVTDAGSRNSKVLEFYNSNSSFIEINLLSKLVNEGLVNTNSVTDSSSRPYVAMLIVQKYYDKRKYDKLLPVSEIIALSRLIPVPSKANAFIEKAFNNWNDSKVRGYRVTSAEMDAMLDALIEITECDSYNEKEDGSYGKKGTSGRMFSNWKQ